MGGHCTVQETPLATESVEADIDEVLVSPLDGDGVGMDSSFGTTGSMVVTTRLAQVALKACGHVLPPTSRK